MESFSKRLFLSPALRDSTQEKRKLSSQQKDSVDSACREKKENFSFSLVFSNKAEKTEVPQFSFVLQLIESGLKTALRFQMKFKRKFLF